MMIQVLRQLVLLVLLAFVVDASAQTALSKGELFAVVTLDQEVRSLGEPLSVSITNGPATVGSAAIRLARDGLAYDLAANYSPPGNGKAVGVAIVGKLETAANSPKLVLGNYLVVVELDGVSYPAPTEKKLQIVPLGNPALKLEPFDPPSTAGRQKP